MKHITEDRINFKSKLFKKMMFFLVYSRYLAIRNLIVREGCYLNILINDPQWRVRCEVAEQGYKLDILVNDPVFTVRQDVARNGYGLDALINDPELLVQKVARFQKYK